MEPQINSVPLPARRQSKSVLGIKRGPAAPLDEAGPSAKKPLKEPLPLGDDSFQTGDEVEVRLREEGLHGSWHQATICGVKKGFREVQFRHLRDDDGRELAREWVRYGDGSLSAKDGEGRAKAMPLIRPAGPGLPPEVPQFRKTGGWPQNLWIEVHSKDAWWEGALVESVTAIQMRDGDSVVDVVFPRLANLIEQAAVKNIRELKDWDCHTGQWRIRGRHLDDDDYEDDEDDEGGARLSDYAPAAPVSQPDVRPKLNLRSSKADDNDDDVDICGSPGNTGIRASLNCPSCKTDDDDDVNICGSQPVNKGVRPKLNFRASKPDDNDDDVDLRGSPVSTGIHTRASLRRPWSRDVLSGPDAGGPARAAGEDGGGGRCRGGGEAKEGPQSPGIVAAPVYRSVYRADPERPKGFGQLLEVSEDDAEYVVKVFAGPYSQHQIQVSVEPRFVIMEAVSDTKEAVVGGFNSCVNSNGNSVLGIPEGVDHTRAHCNMSNDIIVMTLIKAVR